MPTSNEVLFLKRLLYLKASIDNESTLNTMSVPFEQEKLRDNAPNDYKMIDTNAVMSSDRRSIDNAIEYGSVGSNTMALQPYPIPNTAQGRNRVPATQDGLNLGNHIDYATGNDYKKVQTAIPA